MSKYPAAEGTGRKSIKFSFVKCIPNTVQRISHTAASTHYNPHMYIKLILILYQIYTKDEGAC
jgi:hypothetical protein